MTVLPFTTPTKPKLVAETTSRGFGIMISLFDLNLIDFVCGGKLRSHNLNELGPKFEAYALNT